MYSVERNYNFIFELCCVLGLLRVVLMASWMASWMAGFMACSLVKRGKESKGQRGEEGKRGGSGSLHGEFLG